MRIKGSLETISGLQPGDHVAWVLGSDAEHRRVLSSYFAEGIEAGDRLLYLGRKYGAEHVSQYVRDLGYPVDDLIARGALIILDAEPMYCGDGRFVPQTVVQAFATHSRQAAADGYRALRAAGESEWLLRGWCSEDELLDYELDADGATAASPLIGLCMYDAREADPASLAAIGAVHSARLSTTPAVALDDVALCHDGDAYAVEGEVDLTSVTSFARATTSAARGEGDLILDLAPLRFVDVRGMRTLVELGRRLQRDGGHLRLRNASKTVRRCLDLLDVSEALVLEGA